MSSEPQLWMKRVKSVEREYLASRLAIDRVGSTIASNPTILGEIVKVRDVLQSDANLEGTYIIRIFAEFETGLRKFWNRKRPEEHKKNTPAEVLVDQVAAEAHVPDDVIVRVHNVRELRNLLVHETDEPLAKMQIRDVRSCLCTYLHNLYTIWH